MELIYKKDAIHAVLHNEGQAAVAAVQNIKAVDAVPVIRCGECKHYKDGMCYNPNTYDDEKTCGNTTADWFCADGERKDGEHE